MSALFSQLGRLGAFCLFVVGLIWFAITPWIANHAARGLSSGDWREPVNWVAFAFLLLLGYGLMGRLFSAQNAPLAAMGLQRRAGWLREFGVGAATGWGLLVAAILPSVLIGGLRITFWTAPHQWFLLCIDALVLLLASFAEEVVFRGYPFQRLIEAIGPGLAGLLMSSVFTAYHYNPDVPRAGVLVLFLLGCLLSIAYLRTRALWLPWGLHFAWNAAMGLLFGLPISGQTRFSPIVQSFALAPTGLSGGDYGPEGGVIAVLVLFAGLLVISRVTREYAHLYAQPVIVPGGIPVDIDGVARRQHEAAMGPVVPVSEPKLIQIGGPASSPAPLATRAVQDHADSPSPQAVPGPEQAKE